VPVTKGTLSSASCAYDWRHVGEARRSLLSVVFLEGYAGRLKRWVDIKRVCLDDGPFGYAGSAAPYPDAADSGSVSPTGRQPPTPPRSGRGHGRTAVAGWRRSPSIPTTTASFTPPTAPSAASTSSSRPTAARPSGQKLQGGAPDGGDGPQVDFVLGEFAEPPYQIEPGMQGLLDLPAALDDDHQRDAELTTRTTQLLVTVGEEAGRLGAIDDDADIGVLVFVTEQIRDEMRENTAAGLQPAVTLLDRPYSASSTEAASVGVVADSWSQSLDLGPAGLFRLTHSASTTADSGCGITAFSEDEEPLRRVTAATDLATGDPSQALQLPETLSGGNKE